MCYTEEEIKKYMSILSEYTKSSEDEQKQFGGKTKCCNCQRDDCFSIYSGYKICENCSVLNGHVLGYYDYRDRDRLHFQKKSIYQRKYHYEKKVNQVSQRLQLSDEQRCELIDKLMEIDNNDIEKLNNKFNRKRMISIFYVIKKILEKMGNEKYKLLDINISEQTLAYYEDWWDSYKSLK